MENTVKIVLNNYNGTCCPGQTLFGKVICTFSEEIKCRGIKIRFKGKASTEWQRRRGKRSITFTGEETYFRKEKMLFSDSQGGDDFRIPAGRYEYIFSFALPEELPSSYQGKHGCVKYTIKAIVDRPWKFDYEDELWLNVFSPLDLNFFPNLRVPYRDSGTKEVYSNWCCGSSDKISFDVSLPVTGFVPGREVTIGAYLQNMTNLNIEGITYKIIRGVEFIAHDPDMKKKYCEDPIVRHTESGIGAHSEKTWTCNFILPESLRYPNLLACSIMNLSHYLKISLKLPGLHSDIRMHIPITIGSVPLSGVNTALPGPPSTAYPNHLNTASIAAAPLLEASQGSWD